MRKTIITLQLKTNYYSKRIERLIANEEQNKEIGELVDLICKSQDGNEELSEIFSEADSMKNGLGQVLKEIWDNDCTDWNQFKKDQEANG